MPGPLEGIRVLDFTSMVAGPVATMMLADQGAEVIKVEPPRGELMRHLSQSRKGMSAFFLCCNRNKRSLAIDLKAAEGLEIVNKLIATADVLVHNFRPGAAERAGIGEAAVRALRADIIYVSINGYGERGPYANQRAYDPVIQALSGLAEIQRDRDTGRPRMVRTIVADNTTALTRGAGDHRGALRAGALRTRATCADRDARRDDFLSVARSDDEPDLRGR